MAYNPYFSTYQPYNPYQMQAMQNQLNQMQPQAPQQGGGLIWVQGIEGAKSYAVGANQSALLMDSESNCFFIKSADASGMPQPLRIFDYTERAQHAQSAQKAAQESSAYITREEFEKRIAELTAQNRAIENGEKENGK